MKQRRTSLHCKSTESSNASDNFESPRSLTATDKNLPRLGMTTVNFASTDLLRRWEFNALDHPTNKFPHMLLSMLTYTGSTVSTNALLAFISDVEARYQRSIVPNEKPSYHNFTHAFDVAQSVFAILTTMGGQAYISSYQSQLLIIAAIGHDIGHPGVTNQFLINTKHPLALEYHHESSSAILEHMHAATTISLLKKHKLYSNDSKVIANLILATDMGRHSAVLSDAALLPAQKRILNEADSNFFMAFVLHAADLSNPTKSWEVARQWSYRIMDEFFTQGELEASQGDNNISPACDASTVDIPSLQLSFINGIIIPTFEILNQLLGESAAITLTNAQENIIRWKARPKYFSNREMKEFFRKLGTQKTFTSSSSSTGLTTLLLIHPMWTTLILGFTLFALFAEDIQVVAFNDDNTTDLVNAGLACASALFGFDLLMRSTVVSGYFNSFYFYIDLLSVLSLIFDVTGLWKTILASAAARNSFDTAKVTRIGRMIRTTRLVRTAGILRAFQDSIKPKDCSSSTSIELGEIFDKVSQNNDTITSTEIQILMEEAFNASSSTSSRHQRATAAAENVSLVLFSSSSISRKSFVTKILNMSSSQEDRRTRSVVLGQKLGNVATCRLFLLILIILCISPLLSTVDDYNESQDYGLSLLHNVALHNNSLLSTEVDGFIRTFSPLSLSVLGNNFSDHDSSINDVDIVTVSGCTVPPYDIQRRGRAMDDSASDCVSVATFSRKSFVEAKFNILQTFASLLCLCFGAYCFKRDIDGLVMTPVLRMVTLVETLAGNPLRKVPNQSEKNSCTEIQLLEDTFLKISNLVQVGFGEAGSEIIKHNVTSACNFDPMVSGRKVFGIFGFCDIRRFTDTTECLSENVMVFTNIISDIVHRVVNSFDGAPNKNIGDAFLIVWKIKAASREGKILSGNASSDIAPNMFEYYQTESSSSSRHSAADKALEAFCSIQKEISRSVKLSAYKQNESLLKRFKEPYVVKMGYGLHAGWAIEGAIGSRYKIDATYLSSDVNMSQKLEELTKTYNTGLLMSHSFHQLLSNALQDACRIVDVLRITEDTLTSVYCYDQGCDNQEFLQSYQEGFTHYLEGEWESATYCFEDAQRYKPNDGPATYLLSFLKENQHNVPEEWKDSQKYHTENDIEIILPRNSLV